MLHLIFMILSVKANTIFDGRDYNETHVRIDDRVYPVVDCIYKNDSLTDQDAFIIPQLEYKDIPNKQSLFYKESKYRYERFTCGNTNTTCDCLNDNKNVMGYKCYCSYKKAYFVKYFNEKTKKFEGYCELFNSICDQCHPQQTLKCITVSKTEMRCVCLQGFDPASKCYKKFNACDNAPEGSSLSGNAACSVYERNMCLPIIGFQIYYCQCYYPFRENRILGFPNCMGQLMTRCDSILCINGGVCDPTPGRRCICKKGFSGDYCEIVQYQYVGFWTPWSSCFPECGNFGLRSSDAVCNGQLKSHCSGVLRKWERCAAISCDLKFLSTVPNKTIQGLRFELAKMLALTGKEMLALFYILTVGGFTTGLLYICIGELFRPN